MALRIESGFFGLPPADVTMVSFARLVKAGLLPAGAKATDPLGAETLAAFAAKYPGKPAPANLGDLLVALTGDADANGLTDFDVDALAALGVAQLDETSAAKLDAVQQTVFTTDDFAALIGNHASLAPALATDAVQLGQLQQNLWDVSVTSIATAAGPVRIDEQQGNKAFTLTAPMSMSASGKLSLGPGAPGDTSFSSVQLTLNGNAPHFSFQGSAPLELDASPSGLLKDNVGGTLSFEPENTRWLYDALMFQPQVARQLTPGLTAAAGELAKAYALRAQTTPPTDPAEHVVWAVAKVNAAQRDATIGALTQTWGVRPLKWTRWIDDPSEVNTARSVLAATGGQTEIRPSYLFTIAMGEGLLYYLDPANDFQHVDTQQSIDGFMELGVDTFASQVDDLKKKGLVPPWFTAGRDYTVTTNTNELGQTVKSAAFPNLDDGLIALRAMLADCQNRFRADVKKQLGPGAAAKLTADQLDYYTYVYFNAGPGAGAKQLQTRGLAAATKWVGPPPAGNSIARYNSLQRLATLKLVESMKAFPAVSPMKVPQPPATPVS